MSLRRIAALIQDSADVELRVNDQFWVIRVEEDLYRVESRPLWMKTRGVAPRHLEGFIQLNGTRSEKTSKLEDELQKFMLGSRHKWEPIERVEELTIGDTLRYCYQEKDGSPTAFEDGTIVQVVGFAKQKFIKDWMGSRRYLGEIKLYEPGIYERVAFPIVADQAGRHAEVRVQNLMPVELQRMGCESINHDAIRAGVLPPAKAEIGDYVQLNGTKEKFDLTRKEFESVATIVSRNYNFPAGCWVYKVDLSDRVSTVRLASPSPLIGIDLTDDDFSIIRRGDLYKWNIGEEVKFIDPKCCLAFLKQINALVEVVPHSGLDLTYEEAVELVRSDKGVAISLSSPFLNSGHALKVHDVIRHPLLEGYRKLVHDAALQRVTPEQ
jgi:hypothetical protein